MKLKINHQSVGADYKISKVQFGDTCADNLYAYLASVKKFEKKRAKDLKSDNPWVRVSAENARPDLSLLLKVFGVDSKWTPTSVKVR